MPKHIVVQEVCSSSIAGRFGLKAKDLHDHPENAALKKVRPNLNIFAAGEKAVVPKPEPSEKRRMNMCNLFPIPLIACAILLCGCWHSGEIQEFGNDLKRVARSVASEVDSDSSPAGVSKAMREFGKERKALRARWDKLKGNSLSQDEKSQLLSAVGESQSEIKQLSYKHLAETHRNPPFNSALTLLQREFEEYFDMESIH